MHEYNRRFNLKQKDLKNSSILHKHYNESKRFNKYKNGKYQTKLKKDEYFIINMISKQIEKITTS